MFDGFHIVYKLNCNVFVLLSHLLCRVLQRERFGADPVGRIPVRWTNLAANQTADRGSPAGLAPVGLAVILVGFAPVYAGFGSAGC
jgi:hypothetical protein